MPNDRKHERHTVAATVVCMSGTQCVHVVPWIGVVRWVRKRQGRHRGVYIVANKTEGQLTEQMSQTLEECSR